MSEWKYIHRVFVSAWVCSAIAVVLGLYFTHSAWCIWGMLFPACLSTGKRKIEEDSEKENKLNDTKGIH